MRWSSGGRDRNGDGGGEARMELKQKRVRISWIISIAQEHYFSSWGSD
jgi:hypothetical protein